jgi:hypothetical protein
MIVLTWCCPPCAIDDALNERDHAIQDTHEGFLSRWGSDYTSLPYQFNLETQRF